MSFSQEFERYKKLLDTTISSEFLGYDKNITVTVPLEWQKNVDRKFPVIIVFDSQNTRSHGYILNTIDYLTSNEQMPSAVILSIESEQSHRYKETVHHPTSSKSLAFENENFIFEELIPFAEQELNASNFRLFIGHSRYGYFTTSLLFSRIDDLNAVISLSPFFLQENVNLADSISQLEKATYTSKKYYRFSIGNDYPEQFPAMDSSISLLNNSAIDAMGTLFTEADHNVTPGLTISTALYEIFEDWSKIQSNYFSDETEDLSVIASLEKEIYSVYGSDLAFSLGILNGKGWHFYGLEQYDKAIEAWDIFMKAYPNFTEGYLYIIDAQLKLGLDTSVNEKLFKTSLSKTEFFTEEEKKIMRKELEEMMK